MTQSSISSNEQTTRNLEIALELLQPIESKPIVRKLTYDPVTGITESLTFEETNLPYVVITKEQYDNNVHLHRWKVIDGELTPIVKAPPRLLQLVPGNRWYTTAGNMLIIGEDDGWDKYR